MGKVINGVPNWVLIAGGAFAVYYFFIREGGPTFKEPILAQVRGKTERDRYLAHQMRAGKYVAVRTT